MSHHWPASRCRCKPTHSCGAASRCRCQNMPVACLASRCTMQLNSASPHLRCGISDAASCIILKFLEISVYSCSNRLYIASFFSALEANDSIDVGHPYPCCWPSLVLAVTTIGLPYLALTCSTDRRIARCRISDAERSHR